MKRIQIKIDENKVNKSLLILEWGFLVVGALVYVVSMFIQGKDLDFIIKNFIIFVVTCFTLNLLALLFYIFLPKYRILAKFVIATAFILVIPIFSYVSITTNHQSWILSFVILTMVILHFNVGLVIYSSVLIMLINAFFLFWFKDIFVPEFYNIKSELILRGLVFVFMTIVEIYIINIVNNIFKISKKHEEDVFEDREAALKTLNAVRSLSESIKVLGEKNTMFSKNLLTSSETQASSVEEISASTEELMASIGEISTTAVAASEDMTHVVREVKGGMTALNESSVEIKELVKFSKIMLESIESINEIAENTNLLALNAAIEAARAGEAGKGFAVVATEIRKLAEKSTLAAQNVGDLLKESEQKIRNVSESNEKVNQIFTNIYKNLENISKVFQQISFSTQELDKGGKEIYSGLGVINQASNENLDLSKEIEDLNNQFDNESKKLNQIIRSSRRVGLDLVK